MVHSFRTRSASNVDLAVGEKVGEVLLPASWLATAFLIIAVLSFCNVISNSICQSSNSLKSQLASASSSPLAIFNFFSHARDRSFSRWRSSSAINWILLEVKREQKWVSGYSYLTKVAICFLKTFCSLRSACRASISSSLERISPYPTNENTPCRTLHLYYCRLWYTFAVRSRLFFWFRVDGKVLIWSTESENWFQR